MSLQTYGVYGNIEQMYTILQGCGLFNTVTSSVVEGTRTINCNDASGVVLRVICTHVDGNGRETSSSGCGFIYFYGNGQSHACGCDWSDSSETDTSWFPWSVYQTTSSLIIRNCGSYNGTKLKDCLFIISKDNNNELSCLSTPFNGSPPSIWGNNAWFLTKGASTPHRYSSFYEVATTTTLVPFASNDVSKSAFSPKVFRAVCTQIETGQVGLATMNSNDYVCVYGPVFVRID